MIQEALQKSSSEYLDLPDGISTPRKDENTLPAKYTAYEFGQEIEVSVMVLLITFLELLTFIRCVLNNNKASAFVSE